MMSLCGQRPVEMIKIQPCKDKKKPEMQLHQVLSVKYESTREFKELA